MPNLNMGKDRYPLWKENSEGEKEENVSNIVSGDILFGNYAFGYINKANGKFMVLYVGRSESGLAREIIQEMKTERAEGCTHYKYSEASDAKEAFEKECKNFHDFGGAKKLNNKNHPDEPEGHKYPCPVDGCDHPKQ